MSTWQISSDAGSNFRWSMADQQLQMEEHPESVGQRSADTCRLPSMVDLLHQGYTKLMDNGMGNSENAPMFRSGLGKFVPVKQSSIAKARSVLGDMDDVFIDTGQQDRQENGHEFLKPICEMGDLLASAVPLKSGVENVPGNIVNMSNSMFQTGSGKTVNISSAGLLRAKTLLGLGENYDEEFLPGYEQSRQQSTSSEPSWKNLSYLDTGDVNNLKFNTPAKMLSFGAKSSSLGSESDIIQDFPNTGLKPPPVKFQTAGGRSISVSSDALQRARSLLGNPEFDSFLDEENIVTPLVPLIKDRNFNYSSDQINNFISPFSSKEMENGDNPSRKFTSPFRSNSYQKQFGRVAKVQPGNNLIQKFDAEAVNTSNGPYNGNISFRKNTKVNSSSENLNTLQNEVPSEINFSKRPSNGPLVDISNTISMANIDNYLYSGEKRRLGRITSVSQFKKPRNSFVAPLNKINSSAADSKLVRVEHSHDTSQNCSSEVLKHTYKLALSKLAPKEPCPKERVSTRYPVRVSRPYLKEYVLLIPPFQRKNGSLPIHVQKVNPCAAEKYTFQNHEDTDCIGPEAFQKKLSQSGASRKYLTKEWVTNHYKWIVWKLASYERCYPAKFSGKLLTVSNIHEELKYRYEREANHGHRSAIKRILDGDVPPSSMMVLCICSINENHDPVSEPQSVLSEVDANSRAVKVELTDGWYSVKALLDERLSKKLASGKIFLGQKLRIWGAKLYGWAGPISPFEASGTVGLLLHINGTYRCHWAERLGFCKGAGLPLAFKCIKSNGGTVPSTLVGVTRIYPVLYRERLTNGNFIVRSERMEAKVLQLYNKRRSVVAEGIMSASESETTFNVACDHDNEIEEGAKIMKLLEMSAEPEILMAGMSSRQLNSFASYKAKLEAIRLSDMEKSLDRALEEAGLGKREVTPFMRVRVVGLTNKCQPKKCFPQNGLITIWSPTEKQKLALCEGQAYVVGHLVPSVSDLGTLYLQARGSTTSWMPLSPPEVENFEPFFTPRSPVTISNLGDIPLSSEFDIAASVVYVGEVYAQGQQQKQWVFVTDGSVPVSGSTESSDALLAISFCVPYVECDSFVPVNSNVIGSVVGFSNLIKRPRDQVNGLWVAEATENSDFFLTYDHTSRSHLKDVAASVLKWAKTSSLTTEKLKERVLSIIRNSKVGR